MKVVAMHEHPTTHFMIQTKYPEFMEEVREHQRMSRIIPIFQLQEQQREFKNEIKYP